MNSIILTDQLDTINDVCCEMKSLLHELQERDINPEDPMTTNIKVNGAKISRVIFDIFYTRADFTIQLIENDKVCCSIDTEVCLPGKTEEEIEKEFKNLVLECEPWREYDYDLANHDEQLKQRFNNEQKN